MIKKMQASKKSKLFIFIPVVFSLTICATESMASTTYNLRSYFDSLPAAYPSQLVSNEWSFYAGGAGGTLIPAWGANYYGPEQYQQIGALVDVGTSGCSPGYCPANPATSLATFDGVFVHPGSRNSTSVIFRAQSDMMVTELKLQSETVGNANNGNGFDVSVRSFTGGAYHAIGSFAFNYGSTVSTFNETVFNSPFTLGAGEFIEINYGNAGSYLYDHGNVDVSVTSADITSAVPEPESYAMMLAGLGMMSLIGRRRVRMQKF